MKTQMNIKSQTLKAIGKQKDKNNPKKIINTRSHIIFQGDPTFQQASIDYLPIIRRKKIFQDNNSKVLPLDLFITDQAFGQHSNNLRNQRFINQHMQNSLDRNFDSHNNDQGNHQINRKQKSISQRQEAYFQPNNLETDLNFGLIPSAHQDINPAFNSSKASETTQKKGYIASTSIAPKLLNIAIPQPTAPQINFSYQGKEFLKQSDQIVQSRVQKRIPDNLNSPSKSKSRSKSIFLNEGGVMVPKAKGNIFLHDSNYFDFQGDDNFTYHEAKQHINNDVINGISSENIKMGETPEFNNRTNRDGLSNELINNTIINGFNSFETDRNLHKLKKSISENDKFLIKDINNGSIKNPNNSSMISYQSIQKPYDNDYFSSNYAGKSKEQQQKQFNLQKNNSKINQIENSTIRPGQNLLVKAFQNTKNDKKIDQSNSMSFQQDQTSMFDKILKNRQATFNKNKIIQQPQPQIQISKRKSDIKNSNVNTNKPDLKNSYVKNNKSQTNNYVKQNKCEINNYMKVMKSDMGINDMGVNDDGQIHKPLDFISDFNSVPKGVKKSIQINNIADEQYQKAKHRYEQHNDLKKESVMLQSKVKKIDLMNESNIQNRRQKIKQKIQSNNNKKTIKGQKQIKRYKQQKNKRKPRLNNKKLQKQQQEQQQNQNQQIDLSQQQNSQYLQQESIDQVNSSDQQDSSQHHSKYNKKYKKKNKNKNIQNDNQLENFLIKQKQQIHLKQAQKIIQHLPQVKQHLKSKFKKIKSSQQQNIQPNQQPVIIQNSNNLTPQQKQILLAAGIKLIYKNNPSNMQNTNYQLNHQGVGIQLNSQLNQPLKNSAHYFSHHNKNLQLQSSGGIYAPAYGVRNQPNIKDSTPHYHYNPQQYQNQFEQINRRLYNQLNKFMSLNKINNPIEKQQIISNFTLNNPINLKNLQQQNSQIVSSISFKDQNNFTNLNSQNVVYHNTPSNFINGNNQQIIYDNPQRIDYGNLQRDEHSRSNKVQNDLYNKRIYNELKKFNSSKITNSKQKNLNRRDSSVNNDQTRYYSFYHEDSQGKSFIGQPKGQNYIDYDGYYPIRPRIQNIPERDTNNLRDNNNSLRAKFDIRNKFSNSDLQILYRKIQQLTKQIHQQMPLIRKQIQQNQQQIRKIQTNMLIKNTAEQHNLIKMLQKMKMKDIELKQKQFQTHNKDQQLSMYQYQLDQLRNQFYGQKVVNKNLQMENYFQKRLQKMRNYNQNLCSKINHVKGHRISII